MKDQAVNIPWDGYRCSARCTQEVRVTEKMFRDHCTCAASYTCEEANPRQQTWNMACRGCVGVDRRKSEIERTAQAVSPALSTSVPQYDLMVQDFQCQYWLQVILCHPYSFQYHCYQWYHRAKGLRSCAFVSGTSW